MSLSVAINNALSGLTAGQQGVAIISQNVANANTEGYSRKIANQSTIFVGGVGSGVQIDEVTRLADLFLATEARTATSEEAKATAISEIYALAQNLFGAPGNELSVGDDLSRFNVALEALANNPENAGLRFNVVSEAQRLAENVRDLADGAQRLRREADQGIDATVERINNLLLQIDELNEQISRNVANNLPTADLEDQRDLALKRLTSEVDIHSFTRSDGRVTVLTGSGQELVGDEATALTYGPASAVETTSIFGEIRLFPLNTDGEPIGTGTVLVTAGTSDTIVSTFRGGRIAGLLQARDEEMADFAAQVEALSAMVRDEVNAVHNQGTGFPPPNSLTGTRIVTAATAFQATGTVRIAVTDSSGGLLDAVDLDLSALGATTVAGAVSAINTGLAGFATASVSPDGELVITAGSSANGVAINDAGTAETATGRTFSHFFGLNDLFVGAAASNFSVNDLIADDPARVSAALVSTTALVGENAVAVGDNRVARALAGVHSTLFDFGSAGGLAAQRVTLGDYAASLISLNAARATAASDQAEQKSLILENVQNRLDSQTGVNVDEELANLIVFQNAYVMAARVLQTATEMLDVLNDMIR